MLKRAGLRVSPVRPAALCYAGARSFSRAPFRVHRGALTTPRDPIHANQRVECTWTLRRDDVSRVEKLKLLTPGTTLVRVRPELRDELGGDAVARVRVSGSSAEVVRGVHVASLWPHGTVVNFRGPRASPLATQQPCDNVFGHLLTEIDLPHANAVRHLAAIGLGDVVVDQDVLYVGGDGERDDGARVLTSRARWRGRRRRESRDRASLMLLAANESRLFVDAASIDIQLERLKVGAFGTNSQVVVACRALDVRRQLELGVVGGRDAGVSVTADSLVASRLKLAAVGNGELALAVRRHLELDDVSTCAVGKGLVHVLAPPPTAAEARRTTSSARSQSTATLGAACVDTASLATQHANVNSLGASDVRLQARHGLRVRSVGAGVVECVGRLPAQLDVRGLPLPTLIETPVESTDGTEPEQQPNADSLTSPTASDAFEHESLLATPRSDFLARLLGRTHCEDWQGDDGTRRGSRAGGCGHRRRYGRRAEDSWA